MEISQETFPGGSDVALLSRNNLFPDALAGNSLAGVQTGGSPLLMSFTDDVPDVTMDELDRLGVSTVILLGETDALDASVEAELDAAGYTTERVGGIDRYETMNLIANEIGPAAVFTGTEGATAFVSNGQNFPDSLAAGPESYAATIPMILTRPEALHPQADDALDDLAIDHVIILGETAAVSAATEAEIEAKGITTERVGGDDRYDTMRLLADWALANLGWTDEHINVAKGGPGPLDFADALTGGPHGGEENAVTILTKPELPLEDDTVQWLEAHNDTSIQTGHGFGGTAAFSNEVEQAIEDIVNAHEAPASNQAFAVSQDDQLSDTDTAVTYTFTGLDPAEDYAVVLFPCYDDAAFQDGEVITFLDTNEDGIAEYSEDTNLSGEGETFSGSAIIETVNGNAVNNDEAFGVSPTSGGILDVEVNSSSADCARVLVWEDDGDMELELDESNAPTEPFAISGRAAWHDGEAPQGQEPHDTVMYVDTSGPGGVALLTDGFLYFWDDDDGFCAFDCTEDLTVDEFEALINMPEGGADELDLGDAPATPYDRGGDNHFNLDHDDAHPPTDVTLDGTGDLDGDDDAVDAELSWTAPSPPHGMIDSYDAHVYEDGDQEDCNTGTFVGTFSTADETTNVIAEDLGPGDFCAEVNTITPDGDSVRSEPLRFTVPAGDVPTIEDAVLTSDAVTEGEADSGDVWTLTFSEDMNQGLANETLIIDDEDGDRIHVVCDLAVAADDLTSATCVWNTATELEITLAEDAEDRNAAGDDVILYPLTIVDTDNLEDADEGAEVDVAASPDVVIGEGGTEGD